MYTNFFEKVDDKVNAESSKVKNGTIELGGKEINSGSVVLSVNDVELNNEQISNFEKNANGYNISKEAIFGQVNKLQYSNKKSDFK